MLTMPVRTEAGILRKPWPNLSAIVTVAAAGVTEKSKSDSALPSSVMALRSSNCKGIIASPVKNPPLRRISNTASLSPAATLVSSRSPVSVRATLTVMASLARMRALAVPLAAAPPGWGGEAAATPVKVRTRVSAASLSISLMVAMATSCRVAPAPLTGKVTLPLGAV